MQILFVIMSDIKCNGDFNEKTGLSKTTAEIQVFWHISGNRTAI